MRLLVAAALLASLAGTPRASAAPAVVELHTLSWTNACSNSLQIKVFDWDTLDSVLTMTCDSAGDTLRDLAAVRIYGWPTTPGGLARLLQTKNEAGRECLPDTTTVDTQGVGWHFWITSIDFKGNESCSSNRVYIGPITGIPVGDLVVDDPPIDVKFFNIHGQLICCPSASGIYFTKTTYRSGRTSVKRMVMLK